MFLNIYVLIFCRKKYTEVKSTLYLDVYSAYSLYKLFKQASTVLPVLEVSRLKLLIVGYYFFQ